MKIALTMRLQTNPNNGEIQDAISHEWIDHLNKQKNTSIILLSSLSNNISRILKQNMPDLIIFTGGQDLIDEPKNAEEKTLSIRDKFEKKLLSTAIKMRIPCIGVCRGAELIFTYLGGKLVPANKNIHAGKSHKVFLSDTAPAFFTRAMLVNSFHKWAIPLGSAAKIIPFAISEDGLIEAFYHNKMLLMGIMWHPERKFDRSSERKMHSHNFYSNIIKFFKNRRRS